jgi:hypothetical protein
MSEDSKANAPGGNHRMEIPSVEATSVKREKEVEFSVRKISTILEITLCWLVQILPP